MFKESKYCYPGTDILINNAGIKTQEELTDFENTATSQRLTELFKRPVYGKFNLRHLKNIHYYIFQDVYPFAGKIRTERIQKGNTPFANPQYIEQEANKIFKLLKEDPFLRNYPKKKFAEKAAYFMSEINIVHPFREGNGRAQREFIRCLALNAGFTLDWEIKDKSEIVKATIKSITDTTYLSEIILACIE